MKKNLVSKDDWIEILPYGVSFSADGFASTARPVMFFKDAKEKFVLPVWLSPLEAGIALSENQLSEKALSTPHGMTDKILEALGMTLKKCVFKDVKWPHQFVELHFAGSRKAKVIECRADEAISFCLKHKVQFFCQISFIEKCRVVETGTIENPMLTHPGMSIKNPHPYIN